MTAAEIIFLIKTAKYIDAHKMNQDIIKELKTLTLLEKSTTTNINGYNEFAEWTYRDFRKLL